MCILCVSVCIGVSVCGVSVCLCDVFTCLHASPCVGQGVFVCVCVASPGVQLCGVCPHICVYVLFLRLS